jgi:hypothetical protein
VSFPDPSSPNQGFTFILSSDGFLQCAISYCRNFRLSDTLTRLGTLLSFYPRPTAIPEREDTQLLPNHQVDFSLASGQFFILNDALMRIVYVDNVLVRYQNTSTEAFFDSPNIATIKDLVVDYMNFHYN